MRNGIAQLTLVSIAAVLLSACAERKLDFESSPQTYAGHGVPSATGVYSGSQAASARLPVTGFYMGAPPVKGRGVKSSPASAASTDGNESAPAASPQPTGTAPVAASTPAPAAAAPAAAQPSSANPPPSSAPVAVNPPPPAS